MKAVGLNLLVKPINREKTKGGIIIPDLEKDSADELQEAEVVSVGDGIHLGGKLDMGYKKGDTIFYRALKGIIIKKDEETFKIIHIQDIVGKE